MTDPTGMQPIYGLIEKQLREIIRTHGTKLVHSQNEFGAGAISISVKAKVSIKGDDHEFILTLDIDPEDEEDDNSEDDGGW